MKEKYSKPIACVDEFKTVDVITTSDIKPDDNIVDGGNTEDWE